MPVQAPERGAARARLFVALDLPSDARAQLRSWTRDVLGGDESLRLVAEDSLHVTLAFLGWTDGQAVARVAAAASAAAAGHVAPHLTPRELVALPRRRPSVLALDVEDEDGRATALQAAVAAELAEAGLYEPEQRRFRPHVTVARVRRGGRGPTGRFPNPPAASIAARHVLVYRSDLSQEGARYTALARTPLDVSVP